MKLNFSSYSSIFLLGTIFASHMCQMSDAVYIDGMLRLFRGEGNYDDLINGYDVALQGSGGTFPTQTLPTTGAQSRQVMLFNGQGVAHGPANGLPAGAAPRTIIGWFKKDGTSSANGPFGYGDGGVCNKAYYAYLHSGGNVLELDQWCVNEGINPVISSVQADTWYHLAISYDGSKNRGYVNGAKTGTGTPDSAPDTVLGRVAIGGNTLQIPASYSPFKGYVADFAIFNRALTDSEVASIYNAPEGLTSGSLGDNCASDSNCQSSACDSVTSTCKVSDAGTCSTDGDCVSGSCDPNNTCKVSDAGTCSADGDCASGSCSSSSSVCLTSLGNTCSGANDCVSAFCVATVCTDGANGSACSSNTDCQSGSGLVCDSVTSTCKVSLGNTCASNADCQSGLGLVCDSFTSTCKVSLGNTCSGANDCGSAFCVTTVCTDGANGSPCSSNADCTSAYCDTSSTTSQCATLRPSAILPASGGGDPHYILHFNEFITVQPLCDIVLMNALQAYDGLGLTLHARHATPKKGAHFYTYISNLAVKIGANVYELLADTGKLLKNGSVFDIEEGVTYTEKGLPYTIKMSIKGQRKNLVVVEIDGDDSKILLRAHRHFKMAFFEVSGFTSVDVEGFLGKTNMPGLFHRNGTLLAESSDLVDLQSYTNAWQVLEDDLKLFSEKDVFPQAPHTCIFVDTADGIDDNDLLTEKGLGQRLRGSRRRLLSGINVDSKLHASAVDACAHLSDASPKKIWCIDDIMSSGNLELAEDEFYV